MHPFEIMAEPVRRRLVEILASGEHTSGNLAEVISVEFGISWSAVSKHLSKMLDAGFVDVREEMTSRFYRLSDGAISQLEGEVEDLRDKWRRRTDWEVDLVGPGRDRDHDPHAMPPYGVPAGSPQRPAPRHRAPTYRGTARGRRAPGFTDDPWQRRPRGE